MAAANENQGLKIAVAVFVTLSVVLAVTTYFAYSSYSQAEAKRAEAESTAQKALREATESKNQYEFIRDRAGYGKVEEFANLQDAIKKSDKTLDDQLNQVNTTVGKMVEAYRNSGGQQEKVNELSQATAQLISQITSEPNKTYLSSQERLTSVLDNLAQLATSLTLDNEDLRASLADVDQINATQLQVQIDELKKTKDELLNEHDDHQKQREDLTSANDKLRTDNQVLAEENAALKSEIISLKETGAEVKKNLLATVGRYREESEKRETVMDVPAGKVTFVDYHRGEAQTNLTRNMGVRERLVLSVFDRNSPGLPTDAPKAKIEIIQVGNQGSLARILSTFKGSDPIRMGDLVYSPAFSASWPKRFALIGKLDINRDGRDDRADLKRMIQDAGGIVDFDLPPPGMGQPSGRITALTTWFVTDELGAMRPETHVGETEDKAYLDKKTVAVRDAKELGVHPLPLDRLLAQLGYQFNAAMPGRVEVIDQALSEQLGGAKVGAGMSGSGSASQGAPTNGGNTASPAPRGNSSVPSGGFFPNDDSQ